MEPLFVHRAVMMPAEPHQVVEPGRSTRGPVPDVMGVAVACLTAGKAALGVPGRKGAAERGRDGPGLAPDVQCLYACLDGARAVLAAFAGAAPVGFQGSMPHDDD